MVGSPSDDAAGDARSLAEGLLALGRLARTLAVREAGRERLSATQALLLARLVEDGPARVSSLAATLRCGVSTVSESADALVRKGLVRREPDPDDARARRLVPTMRGRRSGARAAEVPPELERALEALPRGSRAALLAALPEALAALQGELDELPSTGRRGR